MRIPPRFVWILALLLVAAPDPAWAQCADGDSDGLCDDVDPCTNVENVIISNPYLRFRKVQGDESMRFLFVGTLAIPSDAPIDPMNKGIRLIVSSTTADDPLAKTTIDVTLPSGEFDLVTDRGWSVGDSGTYLYRDQIGSYAGIARALVKPLDSGQLKVLFFGQNPGGYPLPHQPPEGTITATVVIDAPMATTGQCGEATLHECWDRNQGRKLLCD
jgi:hypothetical protein